MPSSHDAKGSWPRWWLARSRTLQCGPTAMWAESTQAQLKRPRRGPAPTPRLQCGQRTTGCWMSNGTVWKVAVGVYPGEMGVPLSTIMLLAAMDKYAAKRGYGSREAMTSAMSRLRPAPVKSAPSRVRLARCGRNPARGDLSANMERAGRPCPASRLGARNCEAPGSVGGYGRRLWSSQSSVGFRYRGGQTRCPLAWSHGNDRTSLDVQRHWVFPSSFGRR